jgi:hypothetical protein
MRRPHFKFIILDASLCRNKVSTPVPMNANQECSVPTRVHAPVDLDRVVRLPVY